MKNWLIVTLIIGIFAVNSQAQLTNEIEETKAVAQKAAKKQIQKRLHQYQDLVLILKSEKISEEDKVALFQLFQVQYENFITITREDLTTNFGPEINKKMVVAIKARTAEDVKTAYYEPLLEKQLENRTPDAVERENK